MDPILVFAGPSLSMDDRDRDGFEWRSPAAAGDLVALLADPPARLCLIDGYFDGTAAPWHKEILLLMESGTQVFGAASMGALRAAELAPFGMTGVGAIFRAFRDGRLTGDDEVALIHASEEFGWAPLSVPMVEVRATLARACRNRLLDCARARKIRSVAHQIHFADRDWPAIERACAMAGIDASADMGGLRQAQVALKRTDALLCLEVSLTAPRTLATPRVPRTRFIRELAQWRGAPVASTPIRSP